MSVYASQPRDLSHPPWAMLRVLQRPLDDERQLVELGVLIASDPAIASNVLTIVNARVRAPHLPARCIHQAIAIVGATRLQGLCVASVVHQCMGGMLRHPSMRSMWRHSLACAAIAEQLAAPLCLDPGIAFTCGVLHDIGRVALAAVGPEECLELLEAYAGPPEGILAREREVFGFDHCEMGVQLVREWRLPGEFALVVAGHHEPRLPEFSWTMPDLVQMSCRLADAAGFAAFPACQPTPFEELLQELPIRARGLFFTDARSLAFEVRRKIKAIEEL